MKFTYLMRVGVLSIWMSVYRIPVWCPKRPEEDIGGPRTGVRDIVSSIGLYLYFTVAGLDMSLVAHTYNPSTWGVRHEVKAILGYQAKLCL